MIIHPVPLKRFNQFRKVLREPLFARIGNLRNIDPMPRNQYADHGIATDAKKTSMAKLVQPSSLSHLPEFLRFRHRSSIRPRSLGYGQHGANLTGKLARPSRAIQTETVA
jgi:hypothetical protein